MSSIRLVPINCDGLPGRDIGLLPELAQEACAATSRLYRKVGFHPPWIGYLVLENTKVVGTCAFTAALQKDRVEIAYFTFPEFEGRGIATAMARELIAIARAAAPAITITAQTLPRRNASNAILEKLCFKFLGTVEHPEDGEVWGWQLPPEITK